MADENKNTPDINETVSSLKALRDSGANTNAEFKESINLLQKMNTLIENSVAKTQSYEKSRINTKRIEGELEKIERERKKTLNQIGTSDRQFAEEYISNLDKRKNLEDKLIRARSAGNTAMANSLNTELRQTQNLITNQERLLETEDLMLIALVQQEKSLDERVKTLNEEILKEKELGKQVGFVGTLLKLSNKYLGVGGELYGKIVSEARDGETTTKKWVMTTGLLVGAFAGVKAGVGAINKGVTSITGSGGPISKLVSPFTDLISKIPLIGGLLGGVVDMLANLADYATESSSAIQKFGRNLGYSAEQATKINNYFSGIAQSSGDLLYNSRKLRESQTELSDVLGITNIFSEDILKSNIKLKELGELDLETRKELAIVTLNTRIDQNDIAKTLYGQTKSLEKTLGVSFKWQQILKEASSLSGYLGLMFTKYPEKLQKSLMIVKATGLEMKQLDNIANSLLDYESSIASEFEAQLMTGKNINLAKARELFLNNQLVEAAQELTTQIGTSEEFLQLNRFGAEALAKSFGMSRDEFGNMLKQQELFAKVGATDLKTYQQRLVTLNATVQGQKELVSLIGEQEYSNFMNQTATEKIANFIDKIKQSFADLLNNSSFKGFIDKILNFISSPEQIDSMIKKLTGFVSLMIRAVAEIVNGLDYVVRASTLGFGDIDNSIIDRLRGAAAEVGNMNMGIMTNSPAPTTVGGAVAKQNAAGATVNVSQGSMGGGAYTGPKVLELNVTGKIMTADDRTFATYSAKGFNGSYGRSDNSTGNFNASN
jgi:hypothetical protein